MTDRLRGLAALLVALVLTGGCGDEDGKPAEQGEVEVSFCPSLEFETGEAGVEYAEIVFDDLAPPGLTLEQCWNGIGMDAEGRVYIGFTSTLEAGGEDFVVFRYDPKTCERRLLGTFMQAARDAGNLLEGESIPKGHTRLIHQGGKMYMGSQSFHDFKWSIDDLPTYRGGHLFAYDVARDEWEDLAAPLPGGVMLEHQGILGLDILPDRNLLVGVAHPHSDIVVYDYRERTLVDVVDGIPWALGNPLSRELIAAPSGRIYTYRGTEEPSQRDEVHPIYAYDLATKQMTQTEFSATEGFWIGKTATRDGKTVYVATTSGHLYQFDVATEVFTDLGHLLPAADYAAGRRIQYQYTLTLSPDESLIYFVPTQLAKPAGSGELYAYDIAAREVRFVQKQTLGVYTSGDARDQKHLYFAHFGTQANPWSGQVRLFILRPPPPATP
jgi:hypothetical protein